MELLDTRAMIACNRQSHLGLPECPTLFLEFHGSGASISEQLEIVRVLGDANGGGTLRSATATEERNLLWKARHHLLRSEEHTSELQSLMRISYAVFCLKK